MSEEEKKKKVKELQVNGGKRTRCTDGYMRDNVIPPTNALFRKNLQKSPKKKKNRQALIVHTVFFVVPTSGTQAHKDSFAAELKRR